MLLQENTQFTCTSGYVHNRLWHTLWRAVGGLRTMTCKRRSGHNIGTGYERITTNRSCSNDGTACKGGWKIRLQEIHKQQLEPWSLVTFFELKANTTSAKQIYGMQFKKRAPRAIKEVRKFATKAMVRPSIPYSNPHTSNHTTTFQGLNQSPSLYIQSQYPY